MFPFYGLTPESAEKITKLLNEQKVKSELNKKEEEERIQLEKIRDSFHKNPPTNISGMMAYGQVIGRLNKLNKIE